MDVLDFWRPKQGNTLDEYEDAFAGAPDKGLFAIADGATESSFAGSWARRLVKAFIHPCSEKAFTWATWLPPLQEQWAAEMGTRVLPWYAETKLAQGAFATFLGLAIEGALTGGKWHAVAVGDSCLFQVRNGCLLKSFPCTRSDEIGSMPWLVGSRSPPEEVELKKGARAEGDWLAGDSLWLMTDALAQWFLERVEAGEMPWAVAKGPLADPTGACFTAWIEDLRNGGALRNDDVTLAVVCL